MAAERIIGIDFGTSTSVIRVKSYENDVSKGERLEIKEVIFAGKGSTVPTLLQKQETGENCYFGYEAQKKKKGYVIHQNFKMDLESPDEEKRVLARQLTERFFTYLAKEYKSQSEGGHLGADGEQGKGDHTNDNGRKDSDIKRRFFCLPEHFQPRGENEPDDADLYPAEGVRHEGEGKEGIEKQRYGIYDDK